jgi:predicted negative regulator of RcsB-dependent stress response
MTQATTHTKKMQRKDLKQPDEFISLTGQVVDWARKNAVAVQLAVVAAVLLLLIVAGVRWYLQSRDHAAAREFYGASELFKREQWDAAQQDFAKLAESYGSTPYGTLAKLYAGRAALNANRPADAVAPLNEFVASPPSPEMEQIGRVALGRALEATGDAAGARTQLERALALDGPLKPEATMALAQLEEAAGNKEKAIELYQKYLADDADGAAAGLARMRLVGLGVTPPPSTPAMSFPPGIQPLQIP